MPKNIFIIALLILGFGSVVFAAPYFRQEAGLVPLTDSVYYLGTTTPSTNAWRAVITDELCLTADSCKTAWPTGGSGSGTVSTSTIPTVGNLAYWTSAAFPSLLGSVATTSITAGTGVSFTGTAGYLIGGTNLT